MPPVSPVVLQAAKVSVAPANLAGNAEVIPPGHRKMQKKGGRVGWKCQLGVPQNMPIGGTAALLCWDFCPLLSAEQGEGSHSRMVCEEEYELLEKIGRGSYGKVYRAQHDSGEVHAIKVSWAA